LVSALQKSLLTTNATGVGSVPLAGNKQQQTACCRRRALQPKITETNVTEIYRTIESSQYCALL